jgi:Zinc dependent phospholipase C
MPLSGTHITIVQRVAASDPKYQKLLGDPDTSLSENDAEAVKMRFASLGAVGPDVFYAMADFGADLQDLENFLIKVGGTFECIGELMDEISEFVDGVLSTITFGISDSLEQTSSLLVGILKEGLLAALVNTGLNFWPVFEPARQRDLPRPGWFWADYLHYIRSGRFARKLVDLSQASGNDNLKAYAYGYLTHYVTDVVGHPYVNQVVEAPWRLYWQRHHLVENFMDPYVWDRWHSAQPAPSGGGEPPLDQLVSTPNTLGTGAPFTFARLHDHVNIGTPSLGDPVDQLVKDVCDKIHAGLFDLGIAEETESPESTEADFQAWAKMMAQAIKETYDEAADMRPMNLASNFLLKGSLVSRPDGYPTSEDVAAAYGAFRLLLRISTEEKIQEPRPPDILGDISQAVQQLWQDVQNDLAGIPPPPSIPSGGSFSLEALLEAIKSAAEWVAEVAAAVVKAAFDLIKNLINVAGTVVSEPIKYLLYLVNKALYALYRAFRDVLLFQAYVNPYTDQLAIKMGALDTSTLWRAKGNLPSGQYPREAIVAERAKFFSTYSPIVPPTAAAERLPVDFAAPYTEHVLPFMPALITVRTIPDDFIEPGIGRHDMFRDSSPEGGPQPKDRRRGFANNPRDFGGRLSRDREAARLQPRRRPRLRLADVGR